MLSRMPLDGARSLREALAKATGQPPTVHAPDLKQTLGKVAPSAASPAPAPRTIPPEKLRKMLEVEPVDDAS